MCNFILLLALVTASFAQPVEGPNIITYVTEPYHLHDVRITAHNDTAEVFFSLIGPVTPSPPDSAWFLYHLPIPLADLQSFAPATQFDLPEGWGWRMEDVYGDSDGTWIVSMNGGDRFYDDFYVEESVASKLFWGRGNDVGTISLHDDYVSPFGCSGGAYFWTQITRDEAGFLVSSTMRTCQLIWPGGPSEPWGYVTFFPLTNDFDTGASFDFCDESCQGFYGPEWNRHIRISSDSLLVYRGGSGQVRVIILDGNENPSEYQITCDDEFAHLPPLLVKDAQNRILMQRDLDIHQIDYIGNCTDFAHFDGMERADHSAFHASFGFAALQVHPSRLFLARIDTSGTEVQPVGIFYEAQGDTHIVDADLTIADDGRVVVSWSEYDDWSEGARYLKIAWVNWDTFLDSEPTHTPIIPAEFSLSAFPNPFNSEVRIEYSIAVPQDISLSVFNSLGQRVATLVNEHSTVGTHSVSWSPTTGSGIYFVALHGESVSQTTKLLYLR